MSVLFESGLHFSASVYELRLLLALMGFIHFFGIKTINDET